MKLHLACGDVYLLEYHNIDIGGDLVNDCTQEEIELNATTLDNYFKFSFGSERRPIIADKHIDLLCTWEIADESAEEIVMISCFEHFYPTEISHIMNEVQRVLMPGGRFIVDFPDLKEQFLQYYESDPEFYMELVYCNHKDEYSVHHWGYTPETFANLWPDNYIIEERIIVKHDYPMHGMVVTKEEICD
jgi:predicted SAM-dependent methyltransferase